MSRSGSAKNQDLSRSEALIIMTLYLPGQVLGSMGGDGGGEFLHMRLPPGVDIRNMHLDGIQACTVVLLYFWLSSVRAYGSLEMEKEKNKLLFFC